MFRCKPAVFRVTLALMLVAVTAVTARADTPAAPTPDTAAATVAAPAAAPWAAGPPAAADGQGAAGRANIIFMRPSMFGGPVASSVFEIVDGKALLVGVLRSKQRLAYEAAAGAHLFMVMGESADFMSAELSAGKTYHALVTPRMGMWKARFSLRPVHQGELDSKAFGDWQYACALAERQARDDTWAATNAAVIEDKRAKYLPEWQQKPEAQRPALLADDER